MDEGFNQGCPLSSIFAVIVLNKVLLLLNASLQRRATNCLPDLNPHDNGHGGITHLLAYVDDNSTAVPLEDLAFFFTDFERLAKPLSLNINAMKTRIMLSCDGTSALPSIFRELPGHIAKSFRTTLDKYYVNKNNARVEIVDGLRLLLRGPCR